jgi:glycosyltransferase involved in cell wall biosynthesis
MPDYADPLRIAMIAPPWFEVPPPAYGGVEAVVADLVDDLAARGHEITLIGAGQHLTGAHRFISLWPEPPSLRLGDPFPEVVHAALVAEVLDDLDVDVIHDHTLAGPLLGRGRQIPTVITVHGPVNGEEGEYYRALGETVRMVAISEAQRAHAPGLPWAATVHNAIRPSTFPFRTDKEDFVLFLGRMHPNKAPHLAIDAARAAGLPIVLAGKCSEPIELAYLEQEIKPRLGKDTELFGVADAAAKRDLLSRACAMLFPICWEEPFGLVVIEAMACGTPVVALRRGSVPEIIVNGVTGIIKDTPSQLSAGIDQARRLDPAACRAHVATRFNTELMAARYEDAYRRVLAEAVLGGRAMRGVMAGRPATTLARPLPAAVGVALAGREGVQADARHGLAQAAGHLGDDVRVVVERGCLHDRGGPGRRIPGLENPRPHKHPVRAQLHHHRRVRRRRDPARGEQHHRQLARRRHLRHQLKRRRQVLRGGEQLVRRQG